MSGTQDLFDAYKPASAADVAEDNPRMIAGELRALQREMRSGFELITSKLLTAIERLTVRADEMASRMADLERWQSKTDARLAALERPRRKATRFK